MGKVHDYLGIILDYSKPGVVRIYMKDYIKKMLDELKGHIQEQYGVRFKSRQSYYDLFHDAEISWKKTQKRNPKADPEMVQKKRRN